MASDTENGNHAPWSHAPRSEAEAKRIYAQELGHLRSVATGSDDDPKIEGMHSAVSMRTRIRIIEAERSARRINTERTLASVLLGKGSRAESKLFKMAVKDRWPGRILWTLWWFGAVSGMLALVHVGPSFMAFFSVFMLPLPIFALSVLSLDLVWEVLQCFECYIITGMQVLLLGNAIVLIQDRRAVFWAFFFPTMISASLVDAYPAKFRSIFAKLFFTSLGIVYLVWLAFLFFGLMDPVFDKEWEIEELSGKAVSSIAQNTTTLLAFCGRQLASAIRTPNNFVLIMSPMRTQRVHVEPEVEMKDGVWKPTGKFVRESHWRATQLDMDREEMDTFNCKTKFRTKKEEVRSKGSDDLNSQSLGDGHGSFNRLPSVTSHATEGFFEGPDDAATCVTAVATDGRGQTVLDMGVQTNITIPWDYFQDIALCRTQPLIEDVDKITLCLVPKAQQARKPFDDYPLNFSHVMQGGKQGSVSASADLFENRRSTRQSPGASKSAYHDHYHEVGSSLRDHYNSPTGSPSRGSTRTAGAAIHVSYRRDHTRDRL